MVQNLALAAIVAMFATATFAGTEAKKEETMAPAAEAGKDASGEKTAEKKDEKAEAEKAGK